jgi:lipoprotein-releasing system permease protein
MHILLRVALSDVIHGILLRLYPIGFIAAWYPVHHLGKKWFAQIILLFTNFVLVN